MQAIGLCRFSYPALGGFQVGHETIEERIAYLYAEARLEERFRLLETVALPCLKAQTDPDFSIVFLIGDQFPARHIQRLESLLTDLPQAVIHREPPPTASRSDERGAERRTDKPQGALPAISL